MKKIFYKIFPILTVALLTTLTGCLNDSDYDNGINGIKSGVQNFVEIHLTSGNNSNVINEAYDVAATVQTEEVVPIVLTSGPATSDLTIDFIQLTPTKTDPLSPTYSALLDSMVNNWHDAAGKKIDNLNYPTATQLVIANENNKVVIPKGSSVGYIKININPTDFLGKTWVIGFKITGVSDSKYTLSNLTTGIIKFNIKNQYDADYLCNGYRIRPGNPTEAVTDEIRRLSTINATTVQDPKFGNYSSYHVNVEVTTTPMIVGGVTCYKVNATPVDDTGAVKGAMFTTWTGDATADPAPPTNPTDINYYNPVTKTFVLNCYYFSGAGNRIMYEVLVRQ
ncbi:MAG: DUF4361 domain-containing protein [Paludibacter sp.]